MGLAGVSCVGLVLLSGAWAVWPNIGVYVEHQTLVDAFISLSASCLAYVIPELADGVARQPLLAMFGGVAGVAWAGLRFQARRTQRAVRGRGRRTSA